MIKYKKQLIKYRKKKKNKRIKNKIEIVLKIYI